MFSPIANELLETGMRAARELSDSVAAQITNVRYGEPGTILVSVAGNTESIPEPLDVLLVGYPQAARWIARKHFSQFAKYAR